MSALANVKKCEGMMSAQKMLDKESLAGLVTSDEHGVLIAHAVKTIVENKNLIAEQRASQNPNAKSIAKAVDNVKNCLASISARLKRLNASQEKIDAIIDNINAGNFQDVTLGVLEVMAKKNPGLNGRKYEQALKQYAQRQH